MKLNQKGMSLISTLIAAGSVAVIVAGGARLMGTNSKASKKILKMGDEEDLRNMLRERLDCREIIKNEKAACDGATGSAIHGYDVNGNQVVANPGQGLTAGKTKVRLVCWKDNDLKVYRIQASMWPEGQAMTAGTGKKLFSIPLTCGRLGCLGEDAWPDPFTFTMSLALPHHSAGWFNNEIRQRAINCGVVPPPPNEMIRRSMGGTGSGNRWPAGTQGTRDLTTLEYVCSILGYENYDASLCHDNERSGRYPSGKCNFHSAGGHRHTFWNGTTWEFVQQGAPYTRNEFKYGFTWINSITCSGKR